MTANEIFEMVLKDPMLKEKYDISDDLAETISLYAESNVDIIEVLKLVINGIENGTPHRSINQQVKNNFKVS